MSYVNYVNHREPRTMHIPSPADYPAAWHAIAPQVLAKAPSPPHVLTLTGDLGAGKTTLG